MKVRSVRTLSALAVGKFTLTDTDFIPAIGESSTTAQLLLK
jgi:hypothetical protein